MDMVSAISNLGYMSPYNITSINGNPNSLAPISKIGEKNSQKNKALVIAKENKDEDLYVKDYGQLPNTTKLEDGAFARVLSMSSAAQNDTATAQNQGSTVAFYNDTIGMMGYSNMMRNQLTGSGFTPFAAT